MAPKLVTANQLENIELAYDGYDPTWIIGTHNDPLPHWSYGPYAAAVRYRSQADHYRGRPENSYRGFFNDYDPHRIMSTPSYYSRSAAPQVIVSAPGPGPRPVVVKASQVTPVPSVTKVMPPVTKVMYPDGHGHNLGANPGYKNIVIMRIPYCCQGCEEKWKDRLTEIPGFKGVNVDRRHEGTVLRATVFGDMDTHSVVKTIRKYQPRAELWGAAR